MWGGTWTKWVESLSYNITIIIMIMIRENRLLEQFRNKFCFLFKTQWVEGQFFFNHNESDVYHLMQWLTAQSVSCRFLRTSLCSLHMVLVHFLLTLTCLTLSWYSPVHDNGLRETNKQLIHVLDTIQQNNKGLFDVFVICFFCPTHVFYNTFNVMTHSVGFKGFHGTPWHLMWTTLKCDDFFTCIPSKL